jgi:Txe/YoeB family toxin of Txe-Axe toxin-antitoxin module
MEKFEILLTKQAKKDIAQLSPKEKMKCLKVLTETITLNPYAGKKLVGDLEGSYSFRLNIKDRIIYSIDKDNRCIYVKRTKTHYTDCSFCHS